MQKGDFKAEKEMSTVQSIIFLLLIKTMKTVTLKV